MFTLTPYFDERGTLVPMEIHPYKFPVKRLFWVTGVPAGATRGNHAHYKTRQMLICIQGDIIVKLIYPNKEENNFPLMRNQWCFVDKMVWDAQTFSSPSDILLVLADTFYNENDYITDFEVFKQLQYNKC